MADVNLGTLKFLFDIDTRKATGKIDTIEKKLARFGAQMTALVSIPLTALGTKAVSTFAEFEQAMAKVEATSSASAEQMGVLEEKARELGKSTKFSASEVAEGFNYMAMAGWKTNQMLEGIDHTLNLSIASSTDLARTTDIVTDSLTAMKLGAKDTEHFVDVLSQTSRNANTNVELMGETFKYAAPTAGALGISIEDLSLAIGLMANAGVKGSQAGTSLRGGLVNLLKPTDAMAAAMQKYGIELIKNADGSTNLKSTMMNLRNALKSVEQQEQATALATIFGKQSLAGWQAIVNASEQDFNKLASAIANSGGATKEMAEIMGNTFQGKVTALKSAFEEFLITIGEKLIPYFTALIKSLSSALEWFGNLDEGVQSAIVQFGVMAAVLPPLVVVVTKLSGVFSTLSGKLKGLSLAKIGSKIASLNPVVLGLVAAITTLVVAIKGWATYNELLGTTILDTTDDMTWFEKAVAKLTGVEKHSKEELIQMGLVYREFSDNVSPDFVTALENNQRAVYNFNAELDRVNFDKILTEDEAKKLTTDVESLTNGLVNLIKEGGEKGRNELSEWFRVDDGVVDESEKVVLGALERIQNESISEVEALKNDINAIYEQALNDKRDLHEEEILEVKAKHERLRQIELESIAKTNEEVLIAQNTFGARIRNMDLEQATALATQKATERDTNLAQIEGYYNTKITLLQENLEKMTAEEKIAANKELEQLIQKRDAAINQETELWNGIIEQIRINNPLILNEMNLINGKILNEEDKKNQQMLELQKRAYEGLDQITKDGTYNLLNITTGAWGEVTVSVDEATKRITGIYDHTSKKSFGYTTEMAGNISKLAQNHIGAANDIVNAISRGDTAMVTSSNTVATSTGVIIGELEKVKTSADGVKTGFVNINGTPVKIKTNSAGVITELNGVKQAVEKIPPTKNITISKTIKEKTIKQNPNNTTGGQRPVTLGLNLLDADNPMARDKENSDIFTGFESYREKVQAAQIVQDNSEIVKKLDTLIRAVNSRRTTTVKLDERVLVEQITDPIMEEAAWRGKLLW